MYPKKEEAKDFLLNILADGQELNANDIIKDAEANGIKKDTLHNAKRELGIKSIKVGGAVGYWKWRLPLDRILNPNKN